MNHTKTHKLNELVLIQEDKNKIWINRGVSNVYTSSYSDLEGVGFYAARRYFHLKKYQIEAELFLSEEEEEDNEVLPVSGLNLLAEKRVCGVEILDLPCLASGENSNLTSDDMADLRSQVISVNDDKNPAPKTITDPQNITLPQL